MCGIVGLFDTRGKKEIDRQLLARMNQIQVHRGPDEGELHAEQKDPICFQSVDVYRGTSE